MIIDTHCHLIDEAFAGEVDAIIKRAQENDVLKIMLACCDQQEFLQILSLCNQYPDSLFPSIGIHPENIAEDVKLQFDSLFNNDTTKAALHRLKAVGEIGLDLHWDQSRLADQQWLLDAQTRWAIEHDLPLLLHIRDAMPEFLKQCKDSLYSIAQAQGKRLRGVLHCYSGNIEQAREALELGDFLFGIGGTLTYKKSQVPAVAQAIGIDHILLETDAPYLAPMPYRGKRNEPAYTAITCRALAEILGKSEQEVAERTSENARRLLNI